MWHALNLTALILVIVGGINWGLIGLFEFNLVHAIFGASEVLTRTIYVFVGLAAAYMIYYAIAVEGRDRTRHRTTMRA